MNIGLTGSTGVLGSILKKKLKLKKKNLFINKIENFNDVKNWIIKNNFDYIIHLAAIVPTKTVNNNKNKALLVNYLGTKNLVKAINIYSKKKIWLFYSSTSHVYKFKKNKIIETDKTKPISFYGHTKLKGEKYILKNQIMYKPCIGRIFSFTSKKQNKKFIIPSIITKLKKRSKYLVFKNLNHERDFLRLDDVIFYILKLLVKKTKGIFNICSGEKINLLDILHILNRKYKKNIIIKNDSKKTSLYGSNKKINKIIQGKKRFNYLNYLYKNY